MVGMFNVSFCQIVLQEILLIYTAAYEYIFPPTTSPTLVKNINFGRFVYKWKLVHCIFHWYWFKQQWRWTFWLCSLSVYVVYLLNPLPIFLLKGLHFLMAHKSSSYIQDTNPFSARHVKHCHLFFTFVFVSLLKVIHNQRNLFLSWSFSDIPLLMPILKEFNSALPLRLLQ